jgi:hypothetical protein
MCPRAEAEWKLKNLPKRTAMHAFITAAPSAIFVWGAAAFGLGWWTGNDYAISSGLFVLSFFAVVAVFWGIGWVFRAGLKLIERVSGASEK